MRIASHIDNGVSHRKAHLRNLGLRTHRKRPSIRGSTNPSPPYRSPETSGSAQVRLSHALFSGHQLSGALFDFRAHYCHSVSIETHVFGFRLPANAQERKNSYQKNFGMSLIPQKTAL